MSWNSTLTRKTSLRAAWQRKQIGRQIEKRRKTVFLPSKPRKALSTQSKSQKARLARYAPLARIFLADPQNEFCQICIRRRESGEDIRVNYSSEIHHKFLRGGENLFRGFIASCYPCRLWPHDNPAKARELGLLGTRQEIENFR